MVVTAYQIGSCCNFLSSMTEKLESVVRPVFIDFVLYSKNSFNKVNMDLCLIIPESKVGKALFSFSK